MGSGLDQVVKTAAIRLDVNCHGMLRTSVSGVGKRMEDYYLNVLPSDGICRQHVQHLLAITRILTQYIW